MYDTNLTDQKYRALLRSYGLSAVILHVRDEQFPLHQLSTKGDCAEIHLNIARIPEKEYEDYLSYHVRSLVLPHLTLETSRLRIRRFRESDASSMFEFLSDRDSCYMDGGYEPFPSMNGDYRTLMDTFLKDDRRYVIALKKNDQAIGLIHLMPCEDRAVECQEIGYTLNPSQRKKGYAFEALSAFCRFLLQDLLFEHAHRRRH